MLTHKDFKLQYIVAIILTMVTMILVFFNDLNWYWNIFLGTLIPGVIAVIPSYLVAKAKVAAQLPSLIQELNEQLSSLDNLRKNINRNQQAIEGFEQIVQSGVNHVQILLGEGASLQQKMQKIDEDVQQNKQTAAELRRVQEQLLSKITHWNHLSVDFLTMLECIRYNPELPQEQRILIDKITKSFQDRIQADVNVILPEIGDTFNHEFHRGKSVACDTHPVQTIIEVKNCGYIIEGKVYQPADVLVSSGPKIQPSSECNNESTLPNKVAELTKKTNGNNLPKANDDEQAEVNPIIGENTPKSHIEEKKA